MSVAKRRFSIHMQKVVLAQLQGGYLSFTRALLKCIIYDVSSGRHVNGCIARLELVLSANLSMVSGHVD